MTRFCFSFCFTLLVSSAALAQSGAHHRPDSIIGVGTAQLNVISPSADLKLGTGPYVALTAEKPFGQLPLFLDAQVNYIRSSGSANYNFQSPSNLNYVASNVNVTTDIFDADIGLKLKFLETYTVRPYIEVGGVGGFFQLSYDSSLRTPAVVATGSDYKTVDGVLNFGFFTEAGIEISLANWVSLNVAYKYQDTTTQTMDTLRKQTVHYSAGIYYGGFNFRY